MTTCKEGLSTVKKPVSYKPGDLSPAKSIERMIRVDHAGEYGAMRIYQGQLAILGKSSDGPVIAEMAEQEAEHLEIFENLVVERRVRPTALLPLWHLAGFALGAGTALMGKRAAMACTIAVEEVIDEHYTRQADTLKTVSGDTESELYDTFVRIGEEEQEHRDTAINHGGQDAPGYDILSSTVKSGTRLAIWLSERI
ncbi:MAG: demethoxyubiquinone hydroxylase family protein [Rhodospirillales bacterium]|jgi:3-demethoxyubiquinol 3-hydroxylase|nr:demethoxyubiquinone hydroxylase family protein [Rhodospirillales bacterium]